MKKFFIPILIVIVLIFIVIPLIFLIFGIQSAPMVSSGKKLTFEDVARVKQLMRENDPRRLRSGDIRSVVVTERDLNLFLDYALSQAPGQQKLNAQVALLENSAEMKFTYFMPENPFGRYLNIAAVVHPEADQIEIQKLKIGALKIPGWLINTVAKLAHHFLLLFKEYKSVVDVVHSIKNIQISDSQVSVVYQWQPEALRKLRAQGQDFLLPDNEKERLTAYNQRLATVSGSMNGQTVSLARFFQPLFQYAIERTNSLGQPEAENRALILTLAAYSVGRNINRFIGSQATNQNFPKGRVKLTLMGRDDLAKHFLVSAAISVSGGSGLANLAGIFKEMDDSRGGSGFSFADLAADRAGVRFAELAMTSPQNARSLQQQMSDSIVEMDFMPKIDNLPEGIQELEFKHTYKDLDSASYRMVESEIERRITLCRIFQ